MGKIKKSVIVRRFAESQKQFKIKKPLSLLERSEVSQKVVNLEIFRYAQYDKKTSSQMRKFNTKGNKMNLHKTLTREQYRVYKQRVVEYYVRNKFYGVHNLQRAKRAMGKGKDDGAIAILKPIISTLKMLGKITSFAIPLSKYRKAFRNAVFKTIDLIPNTRYDFARLKTTLDFRLRGKIYLPQVEFAITTTCNLKCKNCTNYIPYLPRENQRIITYADFKTYLQNLLKNADKLNALLLLGGEPLLHKELPQMLDFALNCEKIENVYITTNGTIYFSDALRAVFEKHKDNKKLWIWVSNYTANPRLAKRLKSYDLVAYLREKRMNYIFIDDNVWGKSPPPTYAEFKRTDAQNSAYFLACNSPCVSVYGDELSICPRASHFAAKGTIRQKAQDLASVAQIGGGFMYGFKKSIA